MSARSIYPSGVSLWYPDASLCYPGVSWGASAALWVVPDVYPGVIRKPKNTSLMPYSILIICRVICDPSVNHSLFKHSPLPEPHYQQEILGSYHIWNCGLYPRGIRVSVTGQKGKDQNQTVVVTQQAAANGGGLTPLLYFTQ